jgi:hypothetical protein
MAAFYYFQERKERLSKFESIRHSIAGIIKSPKSVLGSSTVSGIMYTVCLAVTTVLLFPGICLCSQTENLGRIQLFVCTGLCLHVNIVYRRQSFYREDRNTFYREERNSFFCSRPPLLSTDILRPLLDGGNCR